MEKTPRGTSVGVDDPYAFAGVCDHLTGDGRCRYAFDHYEHDPAFARTRAQDDYACPVVDPAAESTPDGCGGPQTADTDDEPAWKTCPHFRSRTTDRECVRCGLEEKLRPDEERPLLEEHHLSYSSDGETVSHEITVYLCRWCHAKVHDSWARITDDVAPDPEAVAELEGRRSHERSELAFESAAERYENS